jgi:hypothetical protein
LPLVYTLACPLANTETDPEPMLACAVTMFARRIGFGPVASGGGWLVLPNSLGVFLDKARHLSRAFRITPSVESEPERACPALPE